MGRTNPTYRGILQQIRQEWKPFHRALRQEDKVLFDTMMEHADRYADAAGYQNSTKPSTAALLSIILGQQKQIAALNKKLTSDSKPEPNVQS